MCLLWDLIPVVFSSEGHNQAACVRRHAPHLTSQWWPPVSDQRMASGTWLYGSTSLHQAYGFSKLCAHMLGILYGQGHLTVPGHSSGEHLTASQVCSPPALVNYIFFLGPTSKWPHLSHGVWQQTPQAA